MPYCSSRECGFVIPRFDWEFCPECGNGLESGCPRCGEDCGPNDAEFCVKCGAPLYTSPDEDAEAS